MKNGKLHQCLFILFPALIPEPRPAKAPTHEENLEKLRRQTESTLTILEHEYNLERIRSESVLDHKRAVLDYLHGALEGRDYWLDMAESARSEGYSPNSAFRPSDNHSTQPAQRTGDVQNSFRDSVR